MKPLASNNLSTEDLNQLTGQIIDSAISVHRELGPGMLESAYEACLACELRERGIQAETQVGLPITYKSVQLDVGYRVDILVEEAVVLELKTVKAIAPVHDAQLLSYLRLSGAKVGLLINFHVPLLKDGIKRLVHNLSAPSAPLR
jgi:GxxExxY protein